MPRKMQPREKRDKRDRRKGAGKYTQQRKRTCRFCTDKNFKLDYKSPQLMQYFISERGKIVPRRYTGACAKHQRDITLAVKRARILAVIPFTSTQARGI